MEGGVGEREGGEWEGRKGTGPPFYGS